MCKRTLDSDGSYKFSLMLVNFFGDVCQFPPGSSKFAARYSARPTYDEIVLSAVFIDFH